ncbi:MAG: hypothetical protein JWM53_6151 [bacterium]|nr:hypothetical protein [bacterium]
MHPHRPTTIVRPLMWRLPLVAAILVAGCGAKIGDPCRTNIDCSPLGDRFCDTASTNGYCTKEDCGPTSCPSEAVCIRFFTPLAGDDEACTFDPGIPFSRADCPNVDDRCVCDVTDANNQCHCTMLADDGVHCLAKNGHCAPSSTERHWCERSCSSDSDCRDGYECRRTGTFGAESLPAFNNGFGTPAEFCAPKPTPF